MSVVSIKYRGASTPIGRGQSIRIGRSNGCDLLLLDDPEVSREHCEVAWHGEAISVRDLKSRNGTFINGIQISSECSVVDGDLIFSKKALDRFPEEGEIVAALRARA